ncbi:MAG: PKD domain-containing protein, partial [Bacteroidales bacterium]|nr:PKD domain-containing protein [Bacteroidales bacterium]
MKRLLLLVVICAMCSFAFSQNGSIPLNPTATKSGSLQSNSMSGFSTTFSFNSIESQSISNEKGNFSEIFIDGSFPYGEVGSPSLPMVTRLIAIPEGATPVVTVNGYSENEYALADYGINTLSAQQAPVRKDIDPTTVEYVVNNAAYASNAYTTDEIASVEYLGTMRGIRIGKLTVRPVAYNAAANTVKVYNDINVSVDFENANAALTQSMFASTYSPAFNSIYDQLLNKSILGQTLAKDAYSDHPDMYNTPVRMLVICYSGFRGNSALNQWLQWKLQKGYYVDIFYTDETGTTSSSIKSFIQTKYNASVSAGNAYTYLIVIGDTGQVPQYMTKNVTYDCASDLGYSSVNFTTSSTSNYFPDMFYSRISVENATHLANYVEKVITYEKYQMSDGGAYLNNLILVGGWDSSWTSRVATPTVNYGRNNYFNTSNTTYGGFENGTLNITVSTSSTQGYSGTNNGCYNGINNGVGFLNYTAHGDRQEWYQPKLSATQVATLTNNGKYFFGVGNCCLTGNFNNTTTDYSPGSDIGTNACFAEAMIRVPKAGAVAYVGCSPYSYWYEDFYWAVGAHTYSQGNAPSTSASSMGVYDAMFVDEYWNSASSLLYLGNLAVQQAVTNNNTTSSITDGNCNNSAHYYFQFYHTFGDGSVMPYVTKPEANTVTLPSSVMSGATSMTVNAVAGSYVAVTDNESTIYGVAVANAQGVATVNFSEAIPGSGTLYVVVTRQQYQPYFGTVSVIAPNPPVADFTGTPTTILERESVTFTNNSQYAASYLWNFGDGQTSTEMNPVHTYMTPGTYTVTLRVENTLGNDTKTRTDYIMVNANTNPPVADFEASETEVSIGTTVNFTDLTENIPTSWEWTFEGGSPATSTDQNPSVLYSEPGTYTVTLVAHNAYGDDTKTKNGYITVFYPDVVMSNETVYVCAGTYKDPGGDGDYANSLSYTQTLYPSTEGAKVRLTFSEFSLESSWGSTCYDKFYIYDGTSATGTALVNGVCGTSNPGTVTATNADGALTIMFTSDNSEVSSGWVAEISCYIPGPEVEVQSYTPTTAQYNTTNDLNVVFTNTGVGSTGANTTATLSTTDEYLTLNSTSAILGAIDRNATVNGTFNFSLAENVPDGHVATINVAITDGSNSWDGTLTITAVGPVCDAPTGLQVAVDNADATITWDAQTIEAITISDDFESHEAFTINSPGTVGWTYIDGDGSPTGGISGYTLTNSGSAMAFIVVDPTQVPYTNNTSQNLASRAGVTAHSGTKFIASFYNAAQNNVTLQNDDWIVSPELNFTEDFTFSFYCRGGHRSSNTSYTETYEVYYSTTTNDKSAFTNLLESTTVTGGNNVQWTNKSYTVPSSAKYVAIKYASNDKYYFCVDDITISGNAISGAAAVNIYDNGVLVASNVTGGTYTATNLSVGEHCFSVRAVCNDDSESLATQQCVTIESNLPRYNVTVNAGNGGSVNPNGEQTVYEGNDFTFTVAPNECYEIASVTVDGNNVNLTNNQYTISNVTANHTVNVTFSQLTYTIAATTGNGGTITPAGNTTVNCGEGQTYTIAANDGYRIVDVTVDGQSQGAIESYTFSNVTENHSISATFIAVLNIDINADAEGGSVSPTGTQTIDEGGSFTFTVTPEPCYEIGNVTV